MSAGGGRRRGGHEEEHENHERWLVSYADMITVLMALFIVLFAISQVDQEKYVQLQQSLAAGFGQPGVAVSGGTGVVTTTGVVPNPVEVMPGTGQSPQPVEQASTDTEARRAAAEAEVRRLEEVRDRLKAELERQGLADRVRFRITERGLIAAIVADDVFFANASAQVQPTGLRVLDALVPTLQTIPEDVDVEGHANHLKMSGGQYPTNWELSTARAASVVRHLISGGMPAQRLAASGYSDTRPLYPRDDPQAITGNRRVDVVVVSEQPADVRALLPLLVDKAEQG